VAALAVGKAGEIFAGTAPDGKVYRIDASGAATVYFDPKEKYIWSLAVLPDGSLAVGTGGKTAKIYKIKAANAAPEASLLFDTSETHIISLAVDKTGILYAGTDAKGLVLRFGADGRPFALLDSTLREIHDLSVGRTVRLRTRARRNGCDSAKPAERPPRRPPKAKRSRSRKPRPLNPTPGQKPLRSVGRKIRRLPHPARWRQRYSLELADCFSLFRPRPPKRQRSAFGNFR
jgi:hypothetical protein